MLFKDSYSELQVVLDPQLLYNAICTQRAGSAFNCRLAAELTAGWMSPAFMKSMSSGVQLRPVEKIKHLSLPCRLSTHLLCITLPTCCTHKYTHRLKAGLFRKSDLTYFDVTIVRAMLSSTALWMPLRQAGLQSWQNRNLPIVAFPNRSICIEIALAHSHVHHVQRVLAQYSRFASWDNIMPHYQLPCTQLAQYSRNIWAETALPLLSIAPIPQNPVGVM